MLENIYSLIEAEGWNVITDTDNTQKIQAYGETFPLTHPLNVHLKLYRTLSNPERRYFHMKKVHDILWPDDRKSWNYWAERRFRKHCEAYNYITYAGGGSIGKSYDAAKIALIFYLANPEKRTVIVASTTLAGADSRIWGYVKKLFSKIKIQLPLSYSSHPNPKILFDKKKAGRSEDAYKDNIKDTIHGMFAIAAKKGDDDEAISGWIGRHPDDSMLLVLDEATDMPLAITKAFPNLDSKPEKFQLIAIGNSNSKYDLHGTLSTPKVGWANINPMRDVEWETTQRNGVCLFFSCYESPAIHETDPEKKAVLSTIFLTKEQVENKEKELGKDNDEFWRFVLGFWKTSSSADVVIDQDYISRFKVNELAEWSGVYPISMVWGLDPAFTTGGDSCILRLAMLGVDIDGRVVLDFRGDKLLYRIPMVANQSKSLELQVVDNVIDILVSEGAKVENGCIDANGSGRMLGETLLLRYNSRFKKNEFSLPKKVITSRLGNGLRNVKDDGTVVRTAYDLWMEFKGFMEHQQIRGLDSTSIIQLTHRLVIVDETTRKPKLESKKDFKRRMGHIMKSMSRSPDEADAGSLCLQSAVVNLGFYTGQARSIENLFLIEKMYYAQRAVASQQEHIQEKLDPRNIEANFSATVEDVATVKIFD